jgi:hypothetical protein
MIIHDSDGPNNMFANIPSISDIEQEIPTMGGSLKDLQSSGGSTINLASVSCEKNPVIEKQAEFRSKGPTVIAEEYIMMISDWYHDQMAGSNGLINFYLGPSNSGGTSQLFTTTVTTKLFYINH